MRDPDRRGLPRRQSRTCAALAPRAAHEIGAEHVRFYQPAPQEIFDHLPFWLEEEVPEHGTDLIAIEPYRIEPGSELTPVIRSRLSAITSQVGWALAADPRGGRLALRSPGAEATQKRPRVA